MQIKTRVSISSVAFLRNIFLFSNIYRRS